MDADGLIIPRDPLLSLPAYTYTCCCSPPPLPPAFAASSFHQHLPVRVPNEAQWECSLASSLQASSLHGIPKELGWLGSLFLVPCGLAAPALMHHSHKRANVCTSHSLINKRKKINICLLTNEQTQNKPGAPKSCSQFCEFISSLLQANVMGLLITEQERSLVKNRVLFKWPLNVENVTVSKS